ncbi:MAG: hypothetical protein RSE13_04780 [Planktothrix sp. GU0601_MAG3]|nr:MAG: hypothetical protein RSE13_04780 [Planktothrix sp. GU0601_MAG3]
MNTNLKIMIGLTTVLIFTSGCRLETGLDQTEIVDQDGKNSGQLSYKSLAGDRLILTAQKNGAI